MSQVGAAPTGGGDRGGVSSALELMMKSVEYEVKTRALYPYSNNIPVMPAKLGNEAGLIGAATLAFNNID